MVSVKSMEDWRLSQHCNYIISSLVSITHGANGVQNDLSRLSGDTTILPTIAILSTICIHSIGYIYITSNNTNTKQYIQYTSNSAYRILGARH